MKFDISSILKKVKNIKVPMPKRKPKGDKDKNTEDNQPENKEDAYNISMEDLMAGYGGRDEDDDNGSGDESPPHDDDVDDYLSQFESDDDSSSSVEKAKLKGYEEIEYESIDSTDVPDDEHNPLADYEVDSESEGSDRESDVDDLLSEFTVSEINPLDNMTVYSVDDETSSSEEVVTKVKKERPTLFTMLVIGGIGLVFVLILVIIAVIVAQMLKTAAKNKPEIIEIKTVVQGEYLPNNSDFLLTNDMKQIGDEYIILKKVLIDTAANVFYFKGDIDIKKYSFVLNDSKRRSYGLDLSYILNDGSVDNTGSDKSQKETVLRFEPFGQVVSGFTLEITNIETKEKASFSYSVDKNFKFSTVKYMEQPMEVGELSKGVKMYINSMAFSGAGSVVNYTIEWNHGFDSSITFDAQGKGGDSIYMSENAKRLSILRNQPLEYMVGDNKLLGRMDFAPVANLNAKMYLGFKDLVMNIECDTYVDLMPIFNNKTNIPLSVDLGDYVLNFERIAQKKELVVLVYHAVDKGIEVSDKKDYSNRIEAKIDAQLYAVTEAGIEIPLTGEIHTGQKGTDIIYDVSNYKDFFQEAGNVSYSLHLKSVEIGMDGIAFPVELSTFATKKSDERLEVENAIINAFKTRLLYKSGRSLQSSLTGFSENVLEDTELMANYEMVKLKEQPLTSVQIENITPDNEGVIAIVRESWSSTDTTMRNTHRVRVEKIDRFYVITQDEILY